jgi:hypothetical protein
MKRSPLGHAERPQFDCIGRNPFFQGTASLGSVTSTPYSQTITNLGAGDYLFSAVATDAGGLTATNAISVHVVTLVLSSLGIPAGFPPRACSLVFPPTWV